MLNALLLICYLFVAYKSLTHHSPQEHLKLIVEYVTECNTTQRGMCCVRSIQAHLLAKTFKLFRPHVIRHALNKRLGFKYRTPLKRRIVFSAERRKLGIEFCKLLDGAIRLERRGEAIIIYMDETYCHLHHLPGKMWYRDEDIGTERAERCRSRGSLQIILHVMCRDGWLASTDDDGNVPVLDEWHQGEATSCEMVFRGKVGRGDYHANMDGDMFMMWVNERLVPTVEEMYPDKKVFVVMDNAPYHHGRSPDAFFARSHSKEEIQAKMQELGAETITIKPYADIEDSIEVPEPTAPLRDFAGWSFFEKSTGECYMIDGCSDEGHGPVMVHTRIGSKRFGAVESAREDDFRRLLQDDFVFVGRGDAALLYLRTKMNAQAKLPHRERNSTQHVRQCRRFLDRLRSTEWEYDVADLAKKYNGNGLKGTGGPTGPQLRSACDAYIDEHHPELHKTRVMRRFAELGWEIIFTVPYWAKSQPIELAWALVKNFVAYQYHPGRTHKDLRRHILKGMYGGLGRGGVQHTGLTAELAQKLILHTHKHINTFLDKTRPTHNMRGYLGNLRR